MAVKFVRFYEIETDTLSQIPVGPELAEKAAAAMLVVTDEPDPRLPIHSRLRSERDLVWTTEEEWKGAL